jgi:hypothetical protein
MIVGVQGRQATKCLSDAAEKAGSPTLDKTIPVDLISLALLKTRGLII